jgi:DNA repair photolyase
VSAGPIIYEPTGRAREYAPLAANLSIGCVHRCAYCYGPAQFRRDVATWGEVRTKERALERFERDAAKFAGDPREILLSFSTDPCGTPAQFRDLELALVIADHYRLLVTVLTKNPAALLGPVADLFKRNGWRVGSTVCFLREELRQTWEPGAPPIPARVDALEKLSRFGIRTWASVEPVVDAADALEAIRLLCRIGVEEIRVGHWNHDARAAAVDWRAFHAEAAELLKETPHLFKADLRAAAGVEP